MVENIEGGSDRGPRAPDLCVCSVTTVLGEEQGNLLYIAGKKIIHGRTKKNTDGVCVFGSKQTWAYMPVQGQE